MPDDTTETTAPATAATQVVDLDTRRISAALTGWAQAALDRAMAGLALAEQRWKVTARAWLRAAGAEWPAGFVRLDLRAVADRGDPPEESLTEEHHSMLNLADIAGDVTDRESSGRAAALVAGVMQAALGELADIVARPLARRLVAAGVLERPPLVCAGRLCVGCGPGCGGELAAERRRLERERTGRLL